MSVLTPAIVILQVRAADKADAIVQAGKVLTNLLEILQDPAAVRLLIHTSDPMVIVERLTRSRRESVWS